MEIFAMSALHKETKNIYESIRKNGEAVITDNGKPALLMLDISQDNLEEIMKAVRRTRAMIAFNAMQNVGANNGYMSEDEINAEIQHVRDERRKKS